MTDKQQLKSNLRYHNYRLIKKGKKEKDIFSYSVYVESNPKDKQGRVNPNINVRKRDREYALYLRSKRETKHNQAFQQWKEERDNLSKDKIGRINRQKNKNFHLKSSYNVDKDKEDIIPVDLIIKEKKNAKSNRKSNKRNSKTT